MITKAVVDGLGSVGLGDLDPGLQFCVNPYSGFIARGDRLRTSRGPKTSGALGRDNLVGRTYNIARVRVNPMIIPRPNVASKHYGKQC